MDCNCIHTRNGIDVFHDERVFDSAINKLLKMNKRGVITHPYLVGFILGLIVGVLVGGILTYVTMSGSMNIPFIGG